MDSKCSGESRLDCFCYAFILINAALTWNVVLDDSSCRTVPLLADSTFAERTGGGRTATAPLLFDVSCYRGFVYFECGAWSCGYWLISSYTTERLIQSSHLGSYNNWALGHLHYRIELCETTLSPLHQLFSCQSSSERVSLTIEHDKLVTVKT